MGLIHQAASARPLSENDSQQLVVAQSYAYGGCEIQDAGYYPFGQLFFSDLTHYVATGDFVASLIRNARNVNELAFALGALSHYVETAWGTTML